MVAEYPTLYHNTHDEAVRRDELRLWRKSFRENICCARAIEKAIRHGGGDHIPPDCARGVLEEYGFKRTMHVLANAHREPGPRVQPNEEIAKWRKSILFYPDPEYTGYFEVETSLRDLEEFIGQVREAYQKLGLFDRRHYSPLGDQRLVGKVLVLSPDTLMEEYWTPKSQLWLALTSFGDESNDSVLVATCLGDIETVFWDREDFAGILDEKYLPDWARERINELEHPVPEMGGMKMR